MNNHAQTVQTLLTHQHEKQYSELLLKYNTLKEEYSELEQEYSKIKELLLMFTNKM
jgi:cell shape-determining protein MreC